MCHLNYCTVYITHLLQQHFTLRLHTVEKSANIIAHKVQEGN